MRNDNFDLYFKIADDYIASGYSLSEYYDKGIEPFFKKNNFDCYTIVSKEYFQRVFRYLISYPKLKYSSAKNFDYWRKIYDDFKLSGLTKADYLSNHKDDLRMSVSFFSFNLKAVAFKLAYDEYRSSQANEVVLQTATSEEDCGEELIKVVNIRENSIALEETTSINVASIAPRRLTTRSCNTSVLATEIRVTANGHCISFNSVTPERSVAMVLKALSAS